MKKILSLIISLLLCGMVWGQTIPWFFAPTNQAHPLGNNYMEFQDYSGGSSSYYHDGIDAMAGYGGRPVYSSNTGVVTHISPGTMYGGTMIGQAISGGEGWLYWHIPSSTMQFAVGDSVYTGDFIGRVATWSVANFHHVHFNKVIGTGGYPWSWYISTDNPLNYISPNSDSTAPVFHNALTGQKFAFNQNGTTTYLNPNNLHGQIDIIAHLGDFIGDPAWELNPFEIWYWINGPVSTQPICSFIATGLCPGNNTINVCYQEDATCLTQGDYDHREYFFNLTNTNGDSIIELTDMGNSWNVELFPAGSYWIHVQAKDRFGNTTDDSMQVTLSAGANLAITMTPVNPPIIIPASGGTFDYTITVSNTGASSTTFDGWIMVTLPDSSSFGPVLLVQNLNITAGGSISRTKTQSVPATAPAGEYYYNGLVGDYPTLTVSQNGFNFTKLP